MLVFLPGGWEIRNLAARLAASNPRGDLLILPLYGDLGADAQQQAIQPDPAGRRRVVLATSIAETSLTIEGITTVVDAGWTRMPRFDPNAGLGRLETVRVSRAAAEQRAGRAGRLSHGHCYRLWSRAAHDRLRAYHDPEILHADLAPLALELAQWGVGDPRRLNWLDPPPAGAYAQGRELLRKLDALDDRGQITPMGSKMGRLPLHPRLSHMVFRALESGQQETACDLAALLNERDIFRAADPGGRPCDLELRLHLLDHWRSSGREALTGSGAAAADMRRIHNLSRRWLGRLRTSPVPSYEALSPGALLALAYPDRVARRRGPPGSDYGLPSGRAVRLPDADPLNSAEFLVVPRLDAGRRRGRVFLAAATTEADLRVVLAGHLRLQKTVSWDPAREAVAALRREWLGAIMLSSQSLTRPPPELLIDAMLEGIRSMGAECLPWTDATRQWQARVLSLRAWQPEGDWPDVSDQALMGHLETWLARYLSGIRKRADLPKLKLQKALQNLLDWNQQHRLGELAPTHLTVPSGSRKHLYYEPGTPPVLAVRVQEMFGLADTPRVCGGRIPVMLHLLSPAQRPIQVTQDLSGFWNRTYAEVRKELKGRYPKHHWPEDPWGARPSARARSKSRKPLC
jgi:ATP-dependent helicase HrpB